MSTEITEYTVEFLDQRIGRRRDVEPIIVKAPAPDGTDKTGERIANAIAEAVYRHARKFLMSSGYDVDVELDPHGVGNGWIEQGRFGSFTFLPHRGEVA